MNTDCYEIIHSYCYVAKECGSGYDTVVGLAGLILLGIFFVGDLGLSNSMSGFVPNINLPSGPAQSFRYFSTLKFVVEMLGPTVTQPLRIVLSFPNT